MTKTCYIKDDGLRLNRLTKNPIYAKRGRMCQGERTIWEMHQISIDSECGILADDKVRRTVMDAIEKDRNAKWNAIHLKRSLCEDILNDVLFEGEGSRLLDGTKIAQNMGGFCIGGVCSKESGLSSNLEGESDSRGDLLEGTEFPHEDIEAQMGAPMEIIASVETLKTPRNVASAIETLLDNPFTGRRPVSDNPYLGINYWTYRGYICFDLFTWIKDREEAEKMAFESRHEYAVWDVKHQAELFDQSRLKISDDFNYGFAQFQKHANKYRNAESNIEKIRISQNIYIDTVYRPIE